MRSFPDDLTLEHMARLARNGGTTVDGVPAALTPRPVRARVY
jgi:hypothetical protein